MSTPCASRRSTASATRRSHSCARDTEPAVREHPPRPRAASGLQDGRHVRGRVPRPHAVPLLELRLRDRGRAVGPHEGRHHRLGPQPHRTGRRVRLLVRARVVRAVGRRLRDRHGQLQPRDRLDRLRHERPAVLRAAHARGRAGGAARRGAVGRDPRRDLPARRADAARSREGHPGRGLPHPRDEPRGDRSRRGAPAVQRHPRRRRADRPAPRHRGRPRRSGGRRRGHRLSGAGPPELRARRPRDGDHLRHREPARLLRPHGGRGHRRARHAAAGRPLPR